VEQLTHLLERAQKGDLDAFATIVQRFQKMAAGYAFTVLGDFHLAEDAAQAAFFEAYSNLTKVYNAVAFPAWLRKIVFKQCDRIARKRKLSLVSLDLVAEPKARTGHPAQVFEQEETIQRVRAALLGLPDRERQVAVLFYLCGYSRRQIAEFVDMALEEVIYRLRSARTQFKGRMADMDKSRSSEKGDLTSQAGAMVLAELGLDGEAPQMAQYLGLLKEHSSQWSGQNLLQHSLDVARLADSIASQLGWDGTLARRAGLLHDIGKIADEEPAKHMVSGVKMVCKWGEHMEVREVIWTHHERGRSLSPTCSLLVVSPLCFVVRVADAMAAEQYPHTIGPDRLEECGRVIQPKHWNRSGGLDSYVHRILQLDDMAQGLKGVAAIYLFRTQGGVALLLRTTEESGEIETLALSVAERVKIDWGWEGRVAVTPVSTRAV